MLIIFCTSVTSTAVYAGNSAKTSSGGIQLRSTSNSGIVTTTSGGKARTITVTWADGNTSGRTLDIYGKSTAYSAASDLYNSTSQGTKLGSIKEGTSTKLEITGDYEFIGLRSYSGAMYLTSIEITWETNSGSGSGETPDPELQERNLAFSSTTATATIGEDFTEPTLTGATAGVTYSSSNTSVATVNESTGEVTLVAVGVTTITATAVADATYNAGEASYALTVSSGSQGGETSKTWKLVTDASTLTAGDKLAIVSSSKGTVAGSLTSQYLESIAVTITGNAFSTLPTGAVEFTLGGASSAWTLLVL